MAEQVPNVRQSNEEHNEHDVTEADQKTSNDSNGWLAHADERKSPHAHTCLAETAEAFDTRAFLKLGLIVSAIIVLGFILWSGSDEYYMGKFYRRGYEQKQKESPTAPERHQEF